uniref:Uncharacterized protein n=1 Tax=Pseudomonas phage PACT201 TaxID=3230130 RepID=A0AAU8GS72_9VIRU
MLSKTPPPASARPLGRCIPEDLSGLSYDQLKQQLAGLQDQLKDAEAACKRPGSRRALTTIRDVPFGPSLDRGQGESRVLCALPSRRHSENWTVQGSLRIEAGARAIWIDCECRSRALSPGSWTECREAPRPDQRWHPEAKSLTMKRRALAYAAAVDRGECLDQVPDRDLLKDSANGAEAG